MPHADVQDRRLHYERRGAGEPMLLIQGLSGNHLHWGERFLSRLEDHFDLIAYDHRGVGHSEPHTGDPFTIADLAEDAAGLLGALEIESAHVVGISMGGMTAQELVLHHPQRVRTLTLGCTYAGGPEGVPTPRAVIERLATLAMAGNAVELMRAGLEFNVSPAFLADDEALSDLKAIGRELPTALPVLLAQFQAVVGHDTSDRLKDIRCPTLVIHGSEDQILPAANGPMIAERIPGARLEMLDGVGHLFWWERPERSAELIREIAAGAPVAQ